MDEDSNPTPRASLGVSCSNLNSCKEPILDNSTKLSIKTTQILTVEISSSKGKTFTTELLAKIDEITLGLSKPYFCNALKKLVEVN